MSSPSVEEIENRFKEVQNHIANFLVEVSGEQYHEDRWQYDKGTGGGITRVWEQDVNASGPVVLEKGGVNFSGIRGDKLPQSSTTALKLPEGDNGGFHATGVSLVIHPFNPHVPTIHMNIRYFETNGGDLWWFGGGVDLTPYYPRLGPVVNFHQQLKELCERHGQDYSRYKKLCDDYFFLKHRNENRGVGGIFFDHLSDRSREGTSLSSSDLGNFTKQALLEFVCDLGRTFTELYRPFLSQHDKVEFSAAEREYQLWRRSRYVEFNLLWDRGTKFGIESQGRTESILMSMPAVARWRYDWLPPSDSREGEALRFFFQFQDWLSLQPEDFPQFA